MNDASQTKLQKLLADQSKATEARRQQRAPQASTTLKRKTEKDYDLNNNTFAKIIFDENLTPEQKKEQVAKALTFDVNAPKEENQKRLKEFELFKEFLMSERQRMAQDIISLTDTDAFAEMHEMFNEMNGAIVEFDDSMKPLVDIIDAVYTLRQQGKEMTLNVYKEIQGDKTAEVEKQQKIEALQAELKAQEDGIRADDARIIELQDKKKFWIFGGPSTEEKQEIATLEAGLLTKKEEYDAKKKELQDTKTAPASQTAFVGFEQEKAHLRELLDISSDEHRERQKRLIDAAQNFVDTTAARGEQVLSHFSELGEHIDTLGDANRGIQSVYAILTEASTEAAKTNKSERDQLAVPGPGESQVSKLQREHKKADIEEHIKVANNTALDTVKTNADLVKQGARIMTMKDANQQQISKARELTSSGVASVAEGLSSVLTIVSAAALNESAELASNTVDLMEERTDVQSQQESLRLAAGISDQADELNRAVEGLAAYRDTAKVVRDTTEENLRMVKEENAKLADLIAATKEEIDEVRGIHADAEIQDTAPATTPTSSSFNDKASVKTEEPAVAANDDAPAAPKAQSSLKASPITKLGQ